LTNAALFVLPSDLEGLSLTLLDAMGAGVCVLASDVPENCEVIENTDFVFKRGDVHDLQRMVSLLLSAVRLREIAGGSAQQWVRQHYLWEKVAKEIAAGVRGLDVAGNDAKAIRREFYTVTGSSLAVKWRKNGASWVR
jgi:glycosyltransferase involved in cell wall biosynthesis